MSKWTEQEQSVRDALLENGMQCPFSDCDVIIQPGEDGILGTGVQQHCNTVHPV